jgi:predicted RecA/RadA family phage recombinase
MSKNYVQKGETLTIAAPYDVPSGGGVKSGLIFGIAAGSAVSGVDVDIDTVGVFDLAKVGADVFAVGAAVYWNDSTKLLTSTSSGNTKVGVALVAAGNPSATVRFRLNGTF